MKKELHVLILEDEPTDAELMIRELKKIKLPFKSILVDNKEDFLRELKDFSPDIILGDYKLPSFSGAEAIEIVRKHFSDIPFICVSGTLGEEIAIETLKAGATDYVLKDKIRKLGPAVERALKEFQNVKKRKRFEQELQNSKEALETILKLAPFGIVVVGKDKIIRRINRAALNILGYESEDDVVGKECHTFICPAERGGCPVIDLGQVVDRSERVAITKEKESVPIIKSVMPIVLEGEEVMLETFIDIKAQREVQENLKKQLKDMEVFHKSAIGRELRMIELEKEVNSLLKELGRAAKYSIQD